MAITGTMQTAIVIVMTALSSSVVADALPVGHGQQHVWSDTMSGMYIAGSGDNPWALPQPQRAKPQGPAYQVNPRYVTPEDLQADSLVEPDKQKNMPGSSSKEPSEGYYRNRQPELPYGLDYAPGYSIPGYGGYYGGFPGMYGGAPGFGGNPLLYPYGGGMGLGDPYNLMMQPYSPDSGDEGE